MRKRFKPNISKETEFELDLAPLLAVMVKLVPVLLISSAFVQMMIIETNLPQVVQQAIEKEDKKTEGKALVSVEVNKKDGVKIILTQGDKQQVEVVGLNKDNKFDYPSIHAKFVEIKKLHPEVFKIDFNPDSDIAYKDLVKVMDEARKARNSQVRFPIKDEKTGQNTTTEYMFPQVVFANMMDG